MKRMLFVTVVALLAVSLTASAAIQIKFWDGVDSGSSLADAVAITSGATEPSVVVEADQMLVNDRGVDNYVTGIDGFLVAPATGEYTFYIAGDDDCGLFLSADQNAANLPAAPICEVVGWSGNTEWGRMESQTSAPVTLQAGYHYAFSVSHREGTGGDGLGVAWSGPGIGDDPTVIQAMYVTNVESDIWPIAPLPGAEHVTNAKLEWVYPDAVEGTTYAISFGANPEAMLTLNTPNAFFEFGEVGGLFVAYDTTYYWKVTAGDASSELLSFTSEHNRPQFSSLAGTADAASVAAFVGDAAQLSCAAASYTPSDISYQWYKVVDGNGVEVAGANAADLDIAAATLDDDGLYYCVASNDAGATTSATVMLDIQLVLIHRYTFNDSDVAGNTILDVVGGADATLVNNTGLSVVADGQLTMGNSGQPSNSVNPDSTSDNKGDYVDLPNGLLSSLGATTIEVWTTYQDAEGRAWSRVWDFGNSNAGEDISNEASAADVETIILCPKTGGGNLAIEFRNPSVMLEPAQNPISDSGQAPLNVEMLVTFVQDDLSGLSKMYVNGIPQAVAEQPNKLMDIDDKNNWLGRSQWGGDPMYIGSYNEFRIHDTALSAEEVLANFIAGPDALGEVVEPDVCELNVIGDLNGDCNIDIVDAMILIENLLIEDFYAVD